MSRGEKDKYQANIFQVQAQGFKIVSLEQRFGSFILVAT